MQRAALGVARLARAIAPHARHVWVAAGPGGNGGDGLHAAAELQRAGCHVQVTLVADAARLGADAQQGLRRAVDAGVRVSDALPAAEFDLAIDALLGLGASRAPQGALAAAIAHLNAGAAPVLAVDLPSGLDADTGTCAGIAVRAHTTLALLSLKPGLFTGNGRDQAGTVWFDVLGADLDGVPPTSRLSGASELAILTRPRRHVQHKGSFGEVLLIGGAPGMPGALQLAAHAALAAGAGRTRLAPLDPQALRGDAGRPEWMWAPPGAPDANLLAASTVVCGCGGGDPVREVLPLVLARAARLVLDADGLNAVALDPALRQLLVHRGRRGGPTVLTPHPLEAARLLGCSAAEVQADRLDAATRLAAQFQAIIVLKGSGTVLAAPGRIPTVNSSGDASLATGGSGDVLAGWIGGAWAAADGADPFDVAVGTTWLHGAAAERVGPPAARGLDLVAAMREHVARAADAAACQRR